MSSFAEVEYANDDVPYPSCLCSWKAVDRCRRAVTSTGRDNWLQFAADSRSSRSRGSRVSSTHSRQRATCSLFAKSVVASTVIVKNGVFCRLSEISRNIRGAITFNSSFCISTETYFSDLFLIDRQARAHFAHCYGHALNLACNDAMKRCKTLQDALDTTYEITKLVKSRPNDRLFS